MENTFKNNFEYRNFLTANGTKIMKLNDIIALKNGNCTNNNNNNTKLSNAPYLYQNLTDDAKPFGYAESNLKTLYINKEIQQYQMNNFKLVKPLQYHFNINPTKK